MGRIRYRFSRGNFRYRKGGYYGVKVRYAATYKDTTGANVGTLNAGDWVYFTWSNPPVTGQTYHDHIRFVAYSQGTLFYTGVTYFVNADLDYLRYARLACLQHLDNDVGLNLNFRQPFHRVSFFWYTIVGDDE